jgi:hypothetical protein
MAWFQNLTGFREDRVNDVAGQFLVAGESLTSVANGRTMRHGRFETPTLGELRRRLAELNIADGRLSFREVVGNVQHLHADPANAGALFQVASQFNTLEMVGPSVTPEEGIERYETDRTQGPACAIACGGGTIFRNYLVPLNGGRGQTADRQIDCLADITRALGIGIEMRNGYALPTGKQLRAIDDALAQRSDTERDDLISKLRIGVHHETEVTLQGGGHLVSQAFCSALPIAYNNHRVEHWERFARLVLDAAYEATLTVAAINVATSQTLAPHASAGTNPRTVTRNRTVFLTMLGGGAFGNPEQWIIDAIYRSMDIFAATSLELVMVSYGKANPSLQPFIKA